MAHTTTASVLQTPWDCRWSRLGYRLTGVFEERQPESLWVCVRPDSSGNRRSITDAECATCPHWEAADAHPN